VRRRAEIRDEAQKKVAQRVRVKMKFVVVTGANKGIGLAIARGLLRDGFFVFLGSRDLGRGESAIKTLDGGLESRAQALQLDVESDKSVSSAVEAVKEKLGAGGKLYGLVNNAGVAGGLFENAPAAEAFQSCVGINFGGTRRVTAAFLPLLDSSEGRVVNVSSAAGPNYVSRCDAEKQTLLCKKEITMAELDRVVDENMKIARDGGGDAFGAAGWDSNAYGLSKALVNAYTQLLAREHSALKINACTPGFIATDLTESYVKSSGKSAKELGMKTPDEGAKVVLHLLQSELTGNGRFYGSDCLRSPIHKYRAPGDPEYQGE